MLRDIPPARARLGPLLLTLSQFVLLVVQAARVDAEERPRLRGSLVEHGLVQRTAVPSDKRRSADREEEVAEEASDQSGTQSRSEAEAHLRGTLRDDKRETAVSIGFSAGYTTNAGPALDKVASPVTLTTAEILHVQKSADTQVSVNVVVQDQEFLQRREVGTQQYKLAASYTRNLATGGRLATSVVAEKRVEVEDNLAQTGLSVEYEWSRTGPTPFVKASAFYLDYDDISAAFLESGNQDDRDRLSASALIGMKYDMSEFLTIRGGFGIDAKRYAWSFDDFGLHRDNTSVFPFVSLGYADKAAASVEVFYAPVWRHYREPLFDPLFAHTLTARTELKLNSAWKVFAAAKFGLEETDFLIAKTIQEYVLSVGGLVTTNGGSMIGVALASTLKDYVDFDRVDRKLEAALQAKTPIGRDFFLVAEARYMRFRSTFQEVETDMLMATAGIAYQLNK